MRVVFNEEYATEYSMENYEISIFRMKKHEYETVKKFLNSLMKGDE